jgi:hypothetical protein
VPHAIGRSPKTPCVGLFSPMSLKIVIFKKLQHLATWIEDTWPSGDVVRGHVAMQPHGIWTHGL